MNHQQETPHHQQAPTRELEVDFHDVIGSRRLSVARTQQITPNYRRIVITGEELTADFPFSPFAPTDHVKLFFPNPENGEHLIPIITQDDWLFPQGSSGEPIFRDYTVRAFDAATRELTVDFVLHQHGIAGRWAAHAVPGDPIGVIGPRANVRYPVDYRHYLAFGDETALPAISRMVEEAPAGATVTAVIEVATAAEQQPVGAGGQRATVQWVFRDTDQPQPGHHSALESAVRALPVPDPHQVFVMGAGEAAKMKPIRRYFRKELGLAKRQCDIDGYWKQGVVNLDHHGDDSDG